MLRNERVALAMALAEATHHSSRGQRTATAIRVEVEEQVPNAGLRAQKTPPPEARPGILAEPGPQRSDRILRHSSGDGPLLVVATLAAAAADGLDAATLSFLTARALEDMRKEEEERKKDEVEKQEEALQQFEEHAAPGLWVPATDASGRAYFWHRLSRRVRWTLPAGASLQTLPDSSSSSYTSRKRKKKRRRRPRRRRPTRT